MAIKEVIDVGQAHEMAAALAAALPASVKAPFTPAFVRSARLYDEFIHRLVFSVFRASGLAAAVTGEPSTVDEIIACAGFEVGRARVPVEWILRRLTHRGVLEQTDGRDGATFRARAAVPELDPASVLEEQRRQDPSWVPSYVLAEMVAHDYPAFLRGERTGEEILFSPARLRLWVEFFSNDNGLYAVNNLVGSGAVEEWLPPAPVAILELGGGLGSGAITLLDRLRRAGRWTDIGEYRFTELVPFFLRRGQTALQTRFPDAAFLTYGTLDMNRAFAEQGVAPESVSLVYAVNTLHVARDLDFTARETYRALAPGGRLVVSECIRTTPAQAVYVEFIFNLMETFRSPVLNPTYRPNGGFLTPEQWLDALRAAGFRDVAILPDIAALRDRFPDFNVGAVGARKER
jgi:SAM-dependent methyltransferase